MKKKIPVWAALSGSLALCLICLAVYSHIRPAASRGNYSDEMKIPYTNVLNNEGADVSERAGDHPDSPYFYSADFYNMKSTKTRLILSHFKTIQQTSWWSCGPASVMMVLNYYGDLGSWNEKNLAALRSDHSAQHIGTCLDQMMDMIKGSSKLQMVTTYDYQDNLDQIDMAFFREQILDGYPVLIGWNDWGGHWEVVIGYDTMGTETESDDVLILADPFDTSDHNQDGYGAISAERFIYNFSFYDFFPEGHTRDKCFIVVKPEA